uniref:Uncharacterized protein n=1 Tax=Arundo donax TaxID=35708 RepID=A0A0A9CWW3_ARUDO
MSPLPPAPSLHAWRGGAPPAPPTCRTVHHTCGSSARRSPFRRRPWRFHRRTRGRSSPAARSGTSAACSARCPGRSRCTAARGRPTRGPACPAGACRRTTTRRRPPPRRARRPQPRGRRSR